MATGGCDEFELWLCDKFKQLNTDDSVFSPYVRSILESEEEDDAEKREALVEILSEISVRHILSNL
jgi:hypothetical protein